MTFLNLGFTLLVAVCGGLIAKKCKTPAPFMIGSMIAVAVVSILSGHMETIKPMKIFAQIVSGAYIGQQVSKKDLVTLPKMGPSILGLMSLFTLNMVIVGLMFIVFFRMDPVTAFLSCLPGGIMDVSLMAVDMGAQSDIVATLQCARLVGIMIILPAWVGFITNRFAPELRKGKQEITKPTVKKKQALSKKDTWKNNCFILGVSAMGGFFGLWLGIPVGALTMSLVFSSMLKITRNTPQLSKEIRLVAQLFAGAIIGTNFTQESVLQMMHLIVPIVLLLTSYMLINAFFGYIMFKRKVLDIQSALFASSPAGATDISLMAGELGGDMPKIAGMQISRTLYTVIVMPLLVKLLVSIF